MEIFQLIIVFSTAIIVFGIMCILIAMFLKKTFIAPNRIGILFREGKYIKTLKPGSYRIPNISSNVYLAKLITSKESHQVATQEVLSKDGVTFRISYVIDYALENPEKAIPLLKDFVACGQFTHEHQINEVVFLESQLEVKQKISQLLSADVLENRALLDLGKEEILNIEMKTPGVKILSVRAKDVGFPKNIQEIFAKRLESKMRAQIDLDNARAVVASTRALKNSASLIAADPNLKFLLQLETINTVSKNGKNSFVIGDVQKVV